MKDTHQFRVAGVGTAIGAVLFGALLATSCAPGKLPCEKDEWKAVCEEEPTTGQGGSGGGGGGMGGGSGMGGSTGMGGGGGNVSPVSCSMWPTAAEVAEKLILPKCSKPGGVCHATTFPPKFTTLDEIVPALLNKTPATYCKNDKLIDPANPGKSVILSKVKAPAPPTNGNCPSGGTANAGARMPFTPEPALSQAEIDCLEWWTYEVSK